MWPRAVSFVNACILTEQGMAHSLRFNSRILDVDAVPHRGDAVIDLAGAFVLPGLVNAHDHLELNHYGRIKFRDQHGNVSEWIDDMRPRLQDDAEIKSRRSHALSDRLFVGVLKNLLAGVTTVAHHNPFYRELRRGCPIRVVDRYGWAHSFRLEQAPAGARGEPGGSVAERYRATPQGLPFFVHLAEGVDDSARAELGRLEQLGCLGPNVVLIHGVAIDRADWQRVWTSGAGLVWCPASNVYLFDRTAPVRSFLDATTDAGEGRIALGTDSRLSGSRDLLDEMRAAAGAVTISAVELLDMVTRAGASLLRRPAAGRIRAGGPADLLVLPRLGVDVAKALLVARRCDVQMVAVGGRPLVADRAMAPVFAARAAPARDVIVDGVAKIAHAALVRRIVACPLHEPGLEAA